MRTFLSVLFILTLATVPALSEDASPQIVVTGIGHASAPPDIATLRIEVTQTARQGDAAMADVTTVTDKIMATIRAYGVAERDTETTNLSLREDWDYEDNKRVFKGFTANSSLAVTLRDLTRIGNLITTLSNDGATSIRGPYFDLEDRITLRDAARRNAVKDGMATARLLADAADVTLGMPLLITDGTRASDVMTIEDLMQEQLEEQMEEPMVMEDSAISETGVTVAPPDIEAVETVKLIFRLDP